MTRTSIDASLLAQNPYASANILDNGGLEVWQRGTSFSSPVSGTYTADRWQAQGNIGTNTFTISQSSSTVDTGNFSLEYNITAISGSPTSAYMAQPIENYKAYAGQAVTLSARVWSNVAGAIGVELTDGTQSVDSSAHPGDSAWHTLSVTLTVSNAATGLIAHVGFVLATPTAHMFFMDSVIMTVGAHPVTFLPLNPQVDLARCQRYYFQIDNTNDSIIAMLQCESATTAVGTSWLPVPMRVIPTATYVGTAGTELINATGGGVGTTGVAVSSGGQRKAQWTITVGGGLAAGNVTQLVITSSGVVATFSADL